MTVTALVAGRCFIEIVNPGDESTNSATATFGITVIAPSLKISKLSYSNLKVKVTINAGVKYAKKEVSVWSKPSGSTRATALINIVLNAKGVGAIRVVKTKKVTYYLKYKGKVIGQLVVK